MTHIFKIRKVNTLCFCGNSNTLHITCSFKTLFLMMLVTYSLQLFKKHTKRSQLLNTKLRASTKKMDLCIENIFYCGKLKSNILPLAIGGKRNWLKMNLNTGVFFYFWIVWYLCTWTNLVQLLYRKQNKRMVPVPNFEINTETNK